MNFTAEAAKAMPSKQTYLHYENINLAK